MSWEDWDALEPRDPIGLMRHRQRVRLPKDLSAAPRQRVVRKRKCVSVPAVEPAVRLESWQVAELLGVSTRRVQQLLKQGRIAGAVRVDTPRGPVWYVETDDLTLTAGTRGPSASWSDRVVLERGSR